MASILKRIGMVLFYVGLATLAGIFVIVVVNGTWPGFLKPAQWLFSAVSGYVGDFAIVVQGLLFLGPGILLFKAGEAMERQRPTTGRLE
jgi:hypothetical protein